jgi:hypothetical protein
MMRLGALGQIIERIRVQALKCRNPRGDYIDYEHDDGTRTRSPSAACPVRGASLKVTWSQVVSAGARSFTWRQPSGRAFMMMCAPDEHLR